jgi:hypothetical protein
VGGVHTAYGLDPSAPLSDKLITGLAAIPGGAAAGALTGLAQGGQGAIRATAVAGGAVTSSAFDAATGEHGCVNGVPEVSCDCG